MTVLAQDTLPAALAGLLTEEQQQAVNEAPREKKLETAMSNSFGFGGHNATLIFKAFTG